MTNNTNFNKNSMTELMEMSKTLKVLYAEDNKEARNQTVKLLSNFFNEIGTASDGAEAFEKFSTENYDIIISDINMPVMNGIELLKKYVKKIKRYLFCFSQLTMIEIIFSILSVTTWTDIWQNPSHWRLSSR